MARMKFICDSERCIECNSCVTACKNEHEVPWGVNRRRVVTLNDGVPGETLADGPREVQGGAPCRELARASVRKGCTYTGRGLGSQATPSAVVGAGGIEPPTSTVSR